MSTIQSIQLMRQAHDALGLLAQAQYQLLVIRDRQLAESDRERDLYAEGESKIESSHEELCEKIDLLHIANNLGKHGSPPQQLVRLGCLIDNYAKQHHDDQQEIGRLRGVLDEVNALKANREPAPNELPFEATKLAAIFVSALRGAVVGVDLKEDDVFPWMAAIVMRGYDEHARKYGKLIELCINGDRMNQGEVYTTEAETLIANESDKHVDPGAPPKGWKPAEERTF